MTTADDRVTPAEPVPSGSGPADAAARRPHRDGQVSPDRGNSDTPAHAEPHAHTGTHTETDADTRDVDYVPDDLQGPGERLWFTEPNEPLPDPPQPIHAPPDTRDLGAPPGGGAAREPAAAQDSLTQDSTTQGPPTVVIEEGVIGKRLRRPMDLVRLFSGLVAVAAIAALAYFATSTTSGLGQDLTEASHRLPSVLVLAMNVIAGLGLLTLPVAAAVDMLVRGRGRQLLDAVLALSLTVVLLSGLALVVEHYGTVRWQFALAGSTNPQDTPFLPLLGGIVAFVTVARLMARSPWQVLAGAVIVSLFVVSVITGGTTIAGIGLSLLLGWATGLAVRYALGTPTTRPTGVKVAATLSDAGLPVTVLRAQETTDVGRRYIGIQQEGPPLEVYVLDRDLEGAGLIQAAWRSVRLREADERGPFNMRRSLEHRALLAYAAERAGAPTTRLLAAREVGPDSSLLAYRHHEGQTFAEMGPDEITDRHLDGAWEALGRLRDAGVVHRRLTAQNLILRPDGTVGLLHMGFGTVAAGDVALRIDMAELLCTLGLLVGAERAVDSGRRTLGSEALTKALPVLQPVALSPETKKRIRKNKKLLIDIRNHLIEIRPDAQVEHIELERIKPRTVIMMILGSIAFYVLLSQLAQVDLVELIANAQWQWLIVAVFASVITYPGAAWSLSGFVPERLHLNRTVAAQLAGDFATLIAPPTLGAVAINLRYLQKAGVHPALATASIGVSQVGAFAVHVLLLLGFGFAAGSQQDFSFEPPRAVVLAVVAVVIVIAGLFLLPPIRKLVWGRVGPLLRQVGPRLLTVAQRPWKLAEGLGGMVVLNLGYVVCLAACVEAFGGDLGFAAIAVVYLTGSVVGQAAPTPGGLGAVEAAMAAGLTLAGLNSGLAFSAVLLYRLITFWLPTVPGYFSFNWLQRNDYL